VTEPRWGPAFPSKSGQDEWSVGTVPGTLACHSGSVGTEVVSPERLTCQFSTQMVLWVICSHLPPGHMDWQTVLFPGIYSIQAWWTQPLSPTPMERVSFTMQTSSIGKYRRKHLTLWRPQNPRQGFNLQNLRCSRSV
jgi:hypothetical protein